MFAEPEEQFRLPRFIDQFIQEFLDLFAQIAGCGASRKHRFFEGEARSGEQEASQFVVRSHAMTVPKREEQINNSSVLIHDASREPLVIVQDEYFNEMCVCGHTREHHRVGHHDWPQSPCMVSVPDGTTARRLCGCDDFEGEEEIESVKSHAFVAGTTGESTEPARGMVPTAPTPSPEYFDRYCANCGHEEKLHEDKYGCQHEYGDVYTPGFAPMAGGPCGCDDFEPEEPFEDVESQEHRYGA